MRNYFVSVLFFIVFILPVALLFPKSGNGKMDPVSIERNFQSVADLLARSVSNDTGFFRRLSVLCDTFGNRLSGSENLENAIDWIISKMKSDGLENVRKEPVKVPKWVRGTEFAQIVSLPKPKRISMLGLGGSVGTPTEGITGEVLVVHDFKDLEERSSEARGKIVLFNFPFTTYGETMQYRLRGAIEAGKLGAIASLIRSVTPFSLQTPHTGNMMYEENVPRIPHAAITSEDSLLMERMQSRKEKIIVQLYMEAQTLPDVISHNVIAELKGWEKPDEIVVIGGHIDSWDVGQGAMDDGGGSLAAWSALTLIKRLGLKPRRTIRVVLFTNEENGGAGSAEYARVHENELKNHILAIESDNGVFKPSGFGFSGNPFSFSIIKSIGRLLEPIEAGMITVNNGGTADISPLMKKGIPGMGLHVNMSKYFWYHHTEADTMDKLDNKEFNLCVAAMASMAYIVADLPGRLPR